ncbi:hypothetical protein PUN28_018579 [Cardiocondyla obscurior]|uniref:Uncharacterized protein n=1 Tax=Cardiocondyla obscurior TaxID=286306 RepID=A0AAW2EH98_9HYME
MVPFIFLSLNVFVRNSLYARVTSCAKTERRRGLHPLCCRAFVTLYLLLLIETAKSQRTTIDQLCASKRKCVLGLCDCLQKGSRCIVNTAASLLRDYNYYMNRHKGKGWVLTDRRQTCVNRHVDHKQRRK